MMIYAVLAVLTGVVTFVGGVACARGEAGGDTVLLICLTVLSAIGAVLAGALWPAAAVIGAIVGGIKWADHRKKTEPPPPPKPPTDYDKYIEMAREQRRLAIRARKDGMEELAQMQDDLSAQYERTANIYRRTGPTDA